MIEEMERDELDAMIKLMPADEIATADYCDADTGEIVWEEGERAGDCYDHPESVAARAAEREERLSRIDIWSVDTEGMVNEFENKYSVKLESLRSLCDDPEAMRAADYDVDRDVPVSIARRDGRAISTLDLANTEDYLSNFETLCNEMFCGQIGLDLIGVRNDNTIAVTHFFL